MDFNVLRIANRGEPSARSLTLLLLVMLGFVVGLGVISVRPPSNDLLMIALTMLLLVGMAAVGNFLVRERHADSRRNGSAS